MRRTVIGIYGGTFSPPHIGHIRAAEAFAASLCPDKLMVIPSAIPPHKAPVAGASAKDRVAMCRLAFSHIKNTEISDMEICREGKSYTVQTLRALASEAVTLSMLVGTDMLLSLDGWYCAEEIFSLTEISVIRREEDPALSAAIAAKCEEYRTRYAARLRMIPVAATVLSSSDIRAALAANQPINGRLTPEVEAYIRECHLYQA